MIIYLFTVLSNEKQKEIGTKKIGKKKSQLAIPLSCFINHEQHSSILQLKFSGFFIMMEKMKMATKVLKYT